jgi:hypothetical protein
LKSLSAKFENRHFWDFLRDHQYSMTKTFTEVVSHRFAKPGLSVTWQLGTTVDGSFVWNFDF